MTTNQTIDGVPREQMACMPVERCYDVRAKMIIAFNEARKTGGDLDDALDAAYKSALRFSPNPLAAEQPDRSPEAYAIEHAEYMAKSADNVLAKFSSRADIEVEWPDQHTYTVPDCAGAAIIDCRTAFNKAVKVKT
ncbi:hypothetical protein [Pseudomonas fluorescens]|uniref:hypothetical protein n=1 Tax=Pseudomonas fluorescens TaxID=294 RepID=UPI00372D2416